MHSNEYRDSENTATPGRKLSKENNRRIVNKLKLAVALLLGVALAVGTVAVLVALPRPGAAPASIPWRQTAGPPGGHVRGVIYHPTDPQIAYASAGRAGF